MREVMLLGAVISTNIAVCIWGWSAQVAVSAPPRSRGVLERDTLWRRALGIVLRLGGDAGWVWAKGTLFLFAIVF